MNIKLKAAAEVAGLIAVVVAAAAGTNYVLNQAAAAYGEKAVVEAATYMLVGTAAYVIVGLLYDMRVARLQYKAKLNEMVKK